MKKVVLAGAMVAAVGCGSSSDVGSGATGEGWSLDEQRDSLKQAAHDKDSERSKRDVREASRWR